MDALERRQQFWKRVEIKFLLFGTETIEQRLISNNEPENIVEIFEKFKIFTFEKLFKVDWKRKHQQEIEIFNK